MNLTTKIERAIVTRLVKTCIAAGYNPVRIWDGGEYLTVDGFDSVLDGVFSVSESTIHFAKADGAWGKRGVLIVCGNGEDCISDWHCGDEAFNAAVQSACDQELEVK